MLMWPSFGEMNFFVLLPYYITCISAMKILEIFKFSEI